VPSIAELAERLNSLIVVGESLPTDFMLSQSRGKPVNLDGSARDMVRPELRTQLLRWKGWHAFRRG
jgi:hypothetical protein